MSTAVSSEAWAKLRDWASVAGRGRLLLSGSVAHASLETAVMYLVERGNTMLQMTRSGWRLHTCEHVITLYVQGTCLSSSMTHSMNSANLIISSSETGRPGPEVQG